MVMFFSAIVAVNFAVAHYIVVTLSGLLPVVLLLLLQKLMLLLLSLLTLL